MLYLVEKQTYKFELLKKWKIHNVFHVSLPEEDTTKKEQVDENVTEFETGSNDKKYKMERICDSAVYAKKLATGHLLGLYYLVLWKNYPKEENTWEPALAVQYLQKLISNFHKDNPAKSTATSPSVDTTPPIT